MFTKEVTSISTYSVVTIYEDCNYEDCFQLCLHQRPIESLKNMQKQYVQCIISELLLLGVLLLRINCGK